MLDRPKPWGPKQYCEFRGISEPAAAQERYKGTGPRFIKAGKTLYYDPIDVYDWLDANKVQRTDERPVSA